MTSRRSVVSSVWRKRKPTNGRLPSTGTCVVVLVNCSWIKPPMTTVQPSRTMMLVVVWVMFLLGKVKPLWIVTRSVGELGVNLHADQPVAGNERPQPQLRAGVQKLDALRGTGFGDCLVHIALLLADLDFRPLLVQHHQPRIGDDVGVADLLHGLEKSSQVAVEIAELQAAVEGETGQGRRRRHPARRQTLGFARRNWKLTPNLSSSLNCTLRIMASIETCSGRTSTSATN